jgi:hypothetical protein
MILVDGECSLPMNPERASEAVDGCSPAPNFLEFFAWYHWPDVSPENA